MEVSSSMEVTIQVWTIITILIAIVSFAISITRYRDKVDNSLKNLDDKTKDSSVRLMACELKGNNTDLVIAEMRANIKGIFDILSEIKEKLK